LIKLYFYLFFPLLVFSQSTNKSCETLSKINQLIQEKHYQPKPLNDELSVFVFNNFIENLDNDNSLFLSSEIDFLKKHKLKIDNYIKDNNCSFINDFFSIYKKAISRQELFIAALSKESFDYSGNEVMRFSKKKQLNLSTDFELKKLIKKRILFEILSNAAEISSNKDSINNNLKSILEKSRIKIFENFSCNFNNSQLTEQEFLSVFINSFCSYFDPHTTYFSNSEKSDFLSSLSSSNYSFGINFEINKKNEFLVSEIIPFGPAYYIDKIETGDVLQKIKINNIEYNLNCKNLEEAYTAINANENKKASFSFRKKSGEFFEVELVKQLMKDSQNSVFSYILELDKKRSGYIKIPSFYSKFENGKTNVSDDVKKEIIKLNDSKIKTLIIDLENNGGGSMQEAINLCGLFLKAPAIGLGKNANNQQYIYPNENSSPIFNGKIIILINGFSASASEFFTNAMQDYNMAIVVGSKSYGKASMQEIFEIENESKDFIKITTGTFYRVTGKSHQAQGIEPNIQIPFVFDDQISRENKSKKALKNEPISKVIDNNSFPLTENIKNVILQYKTKSLQNNSYKNINLLKNRINKLYDENLPILQLNFNTVFDINHSSEMLWKDVQKYSKIEYSTMIFNNEYDLFTNKKIESEARKDQIGVKSIKTNFRINESLKILNQLN
jgi:carboxyl-terminal processing protease